MIELASGNLLEADAEALVNTVNTVGVMGKGIALQFRQAFPENYSFYRRACQRGDVTPGRMLVFETGKLTNPRFIINFPTKRHWRGRARLKDIEEGLRDLVAVVLDRRIHAIAVPPLGCGNGGLDWNDVKPLIVEAFTPLTEVRFLLYAPSGAPAAEEMRAATARPNMTEGRAALLLILKKYAIPGYRLSQLEVQKLLYFLQVAGQPLRLNFVKERYGPYAETVHHVLQRIEGHFIHGYGDRSSRARDASIRVLPEAAVEAERFLEQDEKARQRLESVARLIEGFEYPYGLELLATIHWVAQEDLTAKESLQAAVEGVQRWSEHKRKTFPPSDVEAAWQRLRQWGWLQSV
jgi:O-acetyl-ADP-ribose deacetylase (regulator of RNase III)